jgi:hypothetical protein
MIIKENCCEFSRYDRRHFEFIASQGENVLLCDREIFVLIAMKVVAGDSRSQGFFFPLPVLAYPSCTDGEFCHSVLF